MLWIPNHERQLWKGHRVVSSVAFVFVAVGDCETPPKALSTWARWGGDRLGL